MAEWLPDYALIEEELRVNHGNMMLKLNQAAIRVYTSEKYKKRGEAGEIALHAVCRDFFQTIPISPRVFYKSASNDLVKAFDMVHARLPEGEPVELWLGESKLWEQGDSAIADAIKSVRAHVDAGFLANEKLILGPQIPKDTPRYEEIVKLFHKSTSLDDFLKSSVFVEEQGVPIQISERFHAEGDTVRSLGTRLQALAGSRDARISAFERNWVLEALPS